MSNMKLKIAAKRTGTIFSQLLQGLGMHQPQQINSTPLKSKIDTQNAAMFEEGDTS